ncbi:MAG: hypothetical protein ETSY1_46170 (plasmid) [Candidatus Entotheonella factor]|uniref:Uncharacterized protein n=1 Tax=Entotheonella factor TaxID=1429438 RepID=W4M0T2_ENTF1|nr:MAG: hypothetical protein ETSY1_46170 [Candidatus Entotheonella factor]
MRFFFTIELLIARCHVFFPTQSDFNAMFHTGLSGALNRHSTDIQHPLNFVHQSKPIRLDSG